MNYTTNDLSDALKHGFYYQDTNKKILIITNDYWLWINDRVGTSRLGDMVYSHLAKRVRKLEWEHGADNDRNVVAHRPLNGTPVLEGVPLLPEPHPHEEAKAAFNTYIESVRHSSSSLDPKRDRERWLGFLAGYKANPKKWTDEDMQKAFEAGEKDQYNRDNLNHERCVGFDDFLKSLSPDKTPVGFEPILKCLHAECGQTVCDCGVSHVFKSTKDQQGREVLEGRYVYE